MFYYLAPVLLRWILGVEPNDPGPGRHELPHWAVVEPQGAAHELPFLLLEDPRTLPLYKQGLDLLLGD
jgi:hypothetical protein